MNENNTPSIGSGYVQITNPSTGTPYAELESGAGFRYKEPVIHVDLSGQVSIERQGSHVKITARDDKSVMVASPNLAWQNGAYLVLNECSVENVGGDIVIRAMNDNVTLKVVFDGVVGTAPFSALPRTAISWSTPWPPTEEIQVTRNDSGFVNGV